MSNTNPQRHKRNLAALLMGIAAVMLVASLSACGTVQETASATPVSIAEPASASTGSPVTEAASTATPPNSEAGELIRLLNDAGCEFAAVSVEQATARKGSQVINIVCVPVVLH